MKLRILVATAVFGLMGSVAQADWIMINDTTGPYANPSFLDQPTAPGNQNPVTVAAWLDGLDGVTLSAANLAGATSQNDSFNGSSISGLSAGYLTVHFGGGSALDDYLAQNGVISAASRQGPWTMAFACTTSCSSINLLSRAVYGLSGGTIDTNLATSNWRFFGSTPTSVPEPMTLGLLGIGLAGVGLARRRRAA